MRGTAVIFHLPAGSHRDNGPLQSISIGVHWLNWQADICNHWRQARNHLPFSTSFNLYPAIQPGCYERHLSVDPRGRVLRIIIIIIIINKIRNNNKIGGCYCCCCYCYCCCCCNKMFACPGTKLSQSLFSPHLPSTSATRIFLLSSSFQFLFSIACNDETISLTSGGSRGQSAIAPQPFWLWTLVPSDEEINCSLNFPNLCDNFVKN